ncbi:lipopolysaccharide biosynthesis protein [Geobacter sp.]|uniref:lipopolysaccharide biosynthesis protein n=1 Tax=Geobacter sp. TaxID=46610 RepID=UPI002634A091|nr:lipopolysaccharide biosynthesis protein [Geobacter sp.]
MKDLGNRSLSAVFWGSGGTIIRIGLQLVAQVVLARILGPEQYGLFAIGAIVVGFSNFFADIGIAYGLIQKKTINHNDLRFVFTWQIIIGILVSLSIAFASGPIASFFGDKRAHDVVLGMAAICLLNALAAPSLNLLKREMNFKRIQFAQVISYIVGYICVAIPLALAGAQVWSLVIGWLVQASCMFVLLYLATRHAVTPLLWYAEARSLSGYGLTVLATNITNWMINNIDRVIVGRVFLSQQIGFYSTSYNMLYNPTSSLLGVIQPVFFSAASHASNSHERVSRAYLALVSAIMLFILPAFAAVSAISSTFVLALYGDSWRVAGAVFQPIALAMPLFLVWGMTTPLLWAGGAPGREFKSQLPILLVWIVAAWCAAKISLAAVGWAVLLMFMLRCSVILYAACRLLTMPFASVWRAVRRGLYVSIICAGAVLVTDVAMRQLVIVPQFWLIADVAAGLVAFAAAVKWLPGTIDNELSRLVNRIADKCPPPVGRWISLFASVER